MLSLGYLKQETYNYLKRAPIRKFKNTEVGRALYTRGVHVIPNFFSPKECEFMRDEINRLIEKYSDRVLRDSVDSDKRVFGANLASKVFHDYFHNEFIRSIVSDFERASEIRGFTMAARMDFKSGNLGSGNGWHRDSAHYTQLKSIVYLSNTEIENGPFQYLVGSHTPTAFIRGMIKGLYRWDQFRFSEDEIKNYTEAFPEHKLTSFPAAEGTLILADTRGLHRGAPIQSGSRYAATNYFFADMDPPPHLLSHLIVAPDQK